MTGRQAASQAEADLKAKSRSASGTILSERLEKLFREREEAEGGERRRMRLRGESRKASRSLCRGAATLPALVAAAAAAYETAWRAVCAAVSLIRCGLDCRWLSCMKSGFYTILPARRASSQSRSQPWSTTSTPRNHLQPRYETDKVSSCQCITASLSLVSSRRQLHRHIIISPCSSCSAHRLRRRQTAAVCPRPSSRRSSVPRPGSLGLDS